MLALFRKQDDPETDRIVLLAAEAPLWLFFIDDDTWYRKVDRDVSESEPTHQAREVTTDEIPSIAERLVRVADCSLYGLEHKDHLLRLVMRGLLCEVERGGLLQGWPMERQLDSVIPEEGSCE